MRNGFLLALMGVVLVGACGSGDVAPTSPPADRTPPPFAVIADDYASGLSEWEGTTDDVMVTGGLAGIECSEEVEPGPERESHPACIYYVAYEGCADGATRSRSIEEEFLDEPRLRKIYRRAVKDCSDDS